MVLRRRLLMLRIGDGYRGGCRHGGRVLVISHDHHLLLMVLLMRVLMLVLMVLLMRMLLLLVGQVDWLHGRPASGANLSPGRRRTREGGGCGGGGSRCCCQVIIRP